MTVDALNQAGIDAALADRGNRAPPAPPAADPAGSFSFWDMVKAGPRGFGAGVSRYIAGQADVIGAFGQVLGAYPEALGVGSLSPEQQAQADVQRTKLAKDGIDYSSPAGDVFRARSADLLPDPITAHWSENLLGQLGAVFGDVAASTLGAGPLAPVAFGLSEGLTEADKLKAAGVDLPTRTKAATIAGAVQGATIVAPVIGRTALETLGLVAAAGPGAFVAQQAAEQNILRHGGQEKLAAGYDPFDPWGIALSTILPGTIGTVAHLLRAPKVEPITAPKTEPQMRAAAALTPAEQARSDAFEASPGNLAELRAEIGKQKDPARRAILEVELAKQTDGHVVAAIAENPELVDAARVRQVAQAIDTSRLGPDGDIPAMTAHTDGVARAVDQLSNGEPVDLASMPRLPDVEQLRADAAVERIQAADLSRVIVEPEAAAPAPSPTLAGRTLFHGTDQAFDDFRGGMFTSNRARAENYAMSSKGRVLERQIDIRNPMPWDQAFGKSPEEIKAAGYDGTVQWGKDGEVLRAVVVDPAQVREPGAARGAAAPKPAVSPAEAAMQRRVDELVAAAPDRRIRLPDGEEVNLTEALRTVSDEFDADLQHASLATVAAECFLRG